MRSHYQKILLVLLSSLAVSLLTACSDNEADAGIGPGTERAVLISTGNAKIEDLPVWINSVGHVRAQRSEEQHV